MTDVINKLISIFLICTMLLLAPLSLLRQSDRVSNKIAAVNAMEYFLDVVTDAHMIDEHAVRTLTTKLESCGMTVGIKIEIYDVVIAQGKTYMWKTAIITDLTDYTPLELGDIVTLTVTEQTTQRSANLWTAIFGSKADRFNETFQKMVK